MKKLNEMTEKENLENLMNSEAFKTINPQLALVIAQRYAQL